MRGYRAAQTLAAAWLASAMAVPIHAETRLFSGLSQPAPVKVWAMDSGDFNEDGLPDLFAPGEGDSYMSVFLGRGDGTFEDRRIEAKYPLAAAVADFDGDGHQDLATSIDDHSGSVSILLGRGDGTFGAPVDSDAGGHVVRIVVAELDENGRPDLIVTHFNGPGIAVLLGNGDGTFRAPYLPPIWHGVFGVGDMNRDGHADLVMGGRVVQLGRGDGTFASDSPLNVSDGGQLTRPLAERVEIGTVDSTRVESSGVSGSPLEILVDDFDGDGFADVAQAIEVRREIYRDPPVVYVEYVYEIDVAYHGGGYVSYPVGPDPRHLSFADLDGDGRGDLVAAGSYFGDGNVAIFRGSPDGTLAAPVFVPTPTETSGPTVVRDFDRDGVLDLAVASTCCETLSVMFGRGDGTFSTSDRREHRYAGGKYAYDLLLEDLDLDGDLDAATLANSGQPDYANTLSTLVNDGRGGLVEQRIYEYEGAGPVGLATGRLDVDIWPDLVVLNRDSRDVTMLLGEGAGSFLPALRLPVGGSPSAIALEDLDHDGLADLAISHGDSVDAVEIRLNRGGGAFSGSRFFPVGDDPVDVAVADLDGDGHRDLVTANAASGDVSVLRGRVGGSFGPETRIPVGTVPRDIVIADLDANGAPDIVAARNAGAVVVPGNVDGSFGQPVLTDLPTWDAVVADFDRDGRPDLAGRVSSTLVAVALGRGDLSFASAGMFAFSVAYSLAAGDVDGDGRPDLVAPSTARPNTSSIEVLPNRGPGVPPVQGVAMSWPRGETLGVRGRGATRADAVCVAPRGE